MISQRDITAFFTIVDVLASPDKYKQELETLSNMRASVDADLQRVGEETQIARNMQIQADAIIKKQASNERTVEHVFASQEVRAQELGQFEEKLKRAATQQQEISRLLDAREADVAAKEKDQATRATQLDERVKAHAIREEGLRKKEADYAARMEKIRQIAV